jgi:general secretion pathway protein D
LQVGIGLTVTPYINPDGLVVMQIDETIDELAGTTPITGVGDVPNTSSRKLSGEVAVRDGDTVMLGGFIRNDRTAINKGIPILKDIPLLGALFSSKSDDKTREELVVLMRPTVLRTPEIAAAETTRIRKDQMPGIMGAEADEQALQRKAVKQELKEERKRSYNEEAPVTPEERKLYALPPATTP